MANIVELRGMKTTDIQDLLEDAREEMFNLRFQKAQGSLENTARLVAVRREIAQLSEVLRKREWAIKEASKEASVVQALKDKSWAAVASYSYEDGVWSVRFVDDKDNDLASVSVDLNKKRRRTRRDRSSIPPVRKVVNVEVA